MRFLRNGTWTRFSQAFVCLPVVLLSLAPTLAHAATQYVAKFVCGTPSTAPPEGDVPRAALRPGTYTTEINIHNPNGLAISFLKKAVKARPQGFPPQPPSRFRQETLGPDFALAVDCTNIFELFGESFVPFSSFKKGFLVIVLPTGSGPLDVIGVYTVSAGASTATGAPVSMEVVPISPTISK